MDVFSRKPSRLHQGSQLFHRPEVLKGLSARTSLSTLGLLQNLEVLRQKSGRKISPPRFENPIDLREDMQQCYQHYKECKAVNSFPDDPLVRECAAAIREVEDFCERHIRLQELQIVSMSGQMSAMRGFAGG